jgi:hypothetical protein
MEFLLKIAISAAIVAAVATAAQRSTLFGALVASLPLTSILALIWLYHDTKDSARVAALSMGIFWLVIPSLVLFVVLASALKRGFTFYPSLAIAGVSTLAAYGVMTLILSRFGIRA